MPAPLGGATPLVNQDSRFTAEAPAGTSTAQPVVQDGLYRLIGTAADGSGYKLVPAVAADTIASTILCAALHGSSTATTPIGVVVLNPYAGLVIELPYDDAAPTVGQSIAIAAGNVTKVTGKVFARGEGRIMKVDTARLVVEVLLS